MTATIADLRARAAELRLCAADAEDAADVSSITADLLAVRPAMQARLDQLAAEAGDLGAEAAEAEAQLAALQAEIATVQQMLAEASKVVSKAGSATDRAECRIARIGFEQELADLSARLPDARANAAGARAVTAEAERERDKARHDLGEIDGAIRDPLRHERAWLTPSWQARAARSWVSVLSAPEAFTAGHLGVAGRMLDRVLATAAGKQAALDLAAGWRVRRLIEQPNLRVLEDGNYRVEQVSALSRGDPGLADGAAARASAEVNHALAGDMSLAEPVRPEPVTWRKPD